MWLLTLLSLAHARPDRPFPRVDETLVERRFYAVNTAGPATCRWRNRRGKYVCWSFPDGRAARVQEFDKRTLINERRYDAGGRALTTVRYVEGAPASATFHGLSDTEFDLTSWTSSAISEAMIVGPGEAAVSQDSTLWSSPAGRLVATVLPLSGDPLTEDFRRGLERTCGCVLVDRTQTWLHDQPTARYRLTYPDTPNGHVAELWATSRGSTTFVMTWTVPHDDDPIALDVALAPGRVAASLVRWQRSTP